MLGITELSGASFLERLGLLGSLAVTQP